MDKRFEMRISSDLKRKAEELAKVKGMTLAELIRNNLEKEIKKNKIK